MTSHFRRNRYILSCFNIVHIELSLFSKWTIDIAFTELNGFVRKLTCRLDSLLKNQILKPEAYPIDGLST